MFQRQLGAPAIGISRQSSSEFVVSPAFSRNPSQNNSFSRRVPTGGSCGISHSRSRASLLVVCSGPNEPFGEGSPNDASFINEVDSHGHAAAQDEPFQQPAAPSADAIEDAMPVPASSRLPQASPGPIRNDQTWDFSPEPFVPSPANLPTEEDNVLYPPRSLRPLRKDFWTLTDQPGVDLFRVGPMTWDRLGHVYVILFGVGTRSTEGIYSLRAFRNDGSPHETIIAFECEEEAQRYANLLEASMDHTPHVCAIPPRQLLGFCLDQLYSCRLEPRGSLLIPPDFTVSVTDWERSLRLRDGKFAVLEAEPDCFGTATATGTAATATATAPGGGGSSSGGGGSGINLHLHGISGPAGRHPSNLARYSGLTGEDLEDIRARLESLLPK